VGDTGLSRIAVIRAGQTARCANVKVFHELFFAGNSAFVHSFACVAHLLIFVMS